MNKNTFTIDFRNVKYYLEMHFEIARALDFPDYYGCNWSAFWDCLTDWDSLVDLYGETIYIEIIGLDVIERKFDDAADKMISILKEFKHYIKQYEHDIEISVIRGNMRTRIE